MRMINWYKLGLLGLFGLLVACSVSPELDAEMAKQAKTA